MDDELASAASKTPSSNGSRSADASRRSMSGCRPRSAVTKDADGSTAETALGPTRRSSSSVSAPVPHPTSTTRIPVTTPAKSANGADRSRDHRPMKAS